VPDKKMLDTHALLAFRQFLGLAEWGEAIEATDETRIEH
jgi:hypothetical protein